MKNLEWIYLQSIESKESFKKLKNDEITER